ncbi:transposase [Bradyrhizobium sp. UFLA05-109]
MDAIPGVGPALATTLVASVADAKAFRSGRDFSARVRLVPKQNSSGARTSLAVSAASRSRSTAPEDRRSRMGGIQKSLRKGRRKPARASLRQAN